MKKLLKIVTLLTSVFLSGCATLSAPPAQLLHAADLVGELLPEHKQAIVVLADQRRPQQAYLSVWEREGEWWVNKFPTMPAVIGRNGFAAPGEKMEGDGHTPSGTFDLRRAFGYAQQVETELVYRQVSDYDYWSDDPSSAQYNLWVQGTPPLGSFEALKREDDLYAYAVVIEYNTELVIPGKGSAIFLHVWRGRETSTAGCVAASEKDVKKLLKWLDASKKPVIILNDEKN